VNEGWYLMTSAEVERLLIAVRSGSPNIEFGVPLPIDDALAYRNAGNVPDDAGRTLRLVLYDDGGPGALVQKRLQFEPDYQEAPTWKVQGSKPVNVIPLRVGERKTRTHEAWWEDPAMARLEEEWTKSGSIEGVRIPGEYRGFVFKTVVELRTAGKDVTPQAIADSVARWLSPEDAERVRDALITANPASG
jgi:hypothetical protein